MPKRRISTKPNELRDQLLQSTVGINGETNWPASAPTEPEVNGLMLLLTGAIIEVENVKAQLAQARSISAATPIETKSPVSAAFPDGLASYGIALTAADGNVARLDQRLRSARYPVVGRLEAERLVLDLRTVLPRDDRTLVQSITDGELEEAAQPAENMGGA